MSGPDPTATPAPTAGEPAPRPAEGVGQAAISGARFMAFAALAARLMSVPCVIVLGHLLDPGEYALIALLNTTVSFVVIFRNVGLTPLLVSRPEQYERLARPALALGVGANVLAAALLILTSGFWADFFDAPALEPLIWIAAFLPFIGQPAAVFNARASSQRRFRSMAQVQVISAFSRIAALLATAAATGSAVCFLAGTAARQAADSVGLRRIVGPLPPGPTDWSAIPELWRDVRWLMLSGVAMAVITQGDLFVIAKLESKEDLGAYQFGFMLIMSASALATSGLMTVLAPTFKHIGEDMARLRQAVAASTRVLTLVMATAAGLGVVVADPAARLIWGDKWLAAIPVMQVMSATLATRMLGTLALGLLDAGGHFAVRSTQFFIEGALTVAVAVAACYVGGLWAVALAIGIFRSSWVFVQLAVAMRLAGLPRRMIPEAVGGPLVAVAAATAAVLVLDVASLRAALGDTAWGSLGRAATVTAIYSALLAACFAGPLRVRFVEAWTRLSRRG